ncbi:MAG: valine--tRNA ligase [Candidatus Vogelbacteria bacterium RIFOXYD1_FULL_46_19]|uniref:Valine--tRNA ligase n=1 Tax=Candidatus Vogelbacteria bacterium RIFOXYD1_FULL_46_19 TaxID=1802439 RepID=A0A1G2QH57_9BACT|nr:MAG: valine--tRNA ligase [Candidatus Vogelbacteria bacterium RIFOXYD1_FULL_46_19]
MDQRLTKPYNPGETESRIYTKWEQSGYFNPDNLPNQAGKPFTIIMPLPNANGRLHAGHALFIALQDIMTRYKRMRGFRALWVPGADHAGFETQIVYEKKLEKEGRSRFGMDPEALYREIYDFTIEQKKFMEDDVRTVGASCDWSREKFTLEPEIVGKVQASFKRMYDDNLIYRGKRLINWCSKHQTSLSEVETDFIEKTEPFYYFKYGPFTIGTSRPETKFGDKYVVMHPDDKRYADYNHGQQIDVEWINGPITATVIKDEAVDMEFGTGVMTITPWHDQVDFDLAERHHLDKEQIIDSYGKLLPIAGEFAGQKITIARPQIVAKLEAKGLLVKIDDKYSHNLKVCYKCQTPIEPQIKDQWFVKMAPLAKLAVEAVESNKIKFVPDNFRKIFLYWMSNPIDWNISRQIVWGIPIPAKLCVKCEAGWPDLNNELSACPTCGGPVIADTDTFDTWFSSGQWPYLTLDYPDGDSFKKYYPTDIMETGRDLIFKWVPRMVFLSLYTTGQIPFHTVYMHGMVNDAKGQKMSKSKGNVVSPLDLIAKYGADALRIGLVVGNTPGTDLALAENKIKGYKHFTNKLWNISRFILDSTSAITFDSDFSDWSETDHALRTELKTLMADVTDDMENFRFHLAAEKLYHYTWHRLADDIIENSKSVLREQRAAEILSRQQFLLLSLRTVVAALHPFIPFVTEELWGIMNDNDSLLMVESWPHLN